MDALGNIEKIFFNAVVQIDETRAYGASLMNNGLYEINLKENRCKYIGLFEDEPLWEFRLFFSAVIRNNKIYFTPSAASSIYVYEIDTGIIYKIQLPIIDIKGNKKKLKFGDSFIYNDEIIMVGASLPYIMRIDNKDELHLVKMPTDMEVLFRKGVLVNDRYYSCSIKNNVLLEYDLQKEKINLYDIPFEFAAWNIIAVENELYMLSMLKEELCIWNPEKKFRLYNFDSVSNKELVEEEIINRGYIYSYRDDKYIYGVPKVSDRYCIRIEIENISVKRIKIKDLSNKMKIGVSFKTCDKEYLLITENNEKPGEQEGTAQYIIDRRDGRTIIDNFWIDNKNYMDRNIANHCRKMFEKKVVSEKKYSLRDFIKIIKQSDFEEK